MAAEQFNRFFKHMPEYRIILCKRCGYAVIPKQIGGHLSDQHKGEISKKTREAILEFIRGLDNVAWTKDEVIYLHKPVEVILGLPVYHDGIVCKWEGEDGTPCLDVYICRTTRGIQEHCKEKHKWVNCQKRGGNSRAKCREAVNKLWVAD